MGGGGGGAVTSAGATGCVGGSMVAVVVEVGLVGGASRRERERKRALAPFRERE